jgi:hypothetical protein
LEVLKIVSKAKLFSLLVILLLFTSCNNSQKVSKNGLLRIEGRLETKHLDPFTAVFSEGTILVDGYRSSSESKRFNARHPDRPKGLGSGVAIELYNPLKRNSSFVYAPMALSPSAQGKILANGEYLRLGYVNQRCYSKPRSHCIGNEAGYLFNFETQEFKTISNFNPWRVGFGLVPLPDGQALIIGGSGAYLGENKRNNFSSIQFYNPEIGEFKDAGNLPTASWVAAALLVDESHVLIITGAHYREPAEKAILYNIINHEVKTIGSIRISPVLPVVSKIGPETILISGVSNSIYNWKTGKQEVIGEGPSLAGPAIPLPDKRTLVFGGKDVALVDPFNKSITIIDELIHWRRDFSAIMGKDQKIYIVGGKEFKKDGNCCKQGPLLDIEVLDYQELKKRGI